MSANNTQNKKQLIHKCQKLFLLKLNLAPNSKQFQQFLDNPGLIKKAIISIMVICNFRQEVQQIN